MKIYYITNSRIPTEKAHGGQIIKMAEAFGAAGAHTELILPTRRNKKFQGVDIFEFYGAKKNFTIKKLPTFDPVFLLKLRVPTGTFIKLQTLLFCRTVYKYLKRERVDTDAVLYTRDQYLIPLLLKFSKKVIWEAHDLPRRRDRYVDYWKNCDKIIAISRGLKDEMVNLGVSPEKIFVAPDGVDLEIFNRIRQSPDELRKKFDLPPDKKIVLYAGHLYEWKGAGVLAQAAAYMDMNKDAVVVFLGGNDKDIARFKKQHGQRENIRVLGRVRPVQVPEFLRAADVLVLPNSGKSEISAKYTSPLKLFEYMASERPIVASRLPSLQEILNEKNAVLVRPDDPAALAAGIAVILNNSALAVGIAKQARFEAETHGWDQRAKNILEHIAL